jgi:hypothetical protein
MVLRSAVGGRRAQQLLGLAEPIPGDEQGGQSGGRLRAASIRCGTVERLGGCRLGPLGGRSGTYSSSGSVTRRAISRQTGAGT